MTNICIYCQNKELKLLDRYKYEIPEDIKYLGKMNIFECKNYSENPNHHFSISPREYLKASKLGDFKAVYHSHPQGEAKFSPYDIHVSQSMNLNFILYHNSTDEFLFFDPTN